MAPAAGGNDGARRRETDVPLPRLPLDGRLREPLDVDGDTLARCIAATDSAAEPPFFTPSSDLVVGGGVPPGESSPADSLPTLPADRGDPVALPADPSSIDDPPTKVAAAPVPADDRPGGVRCRDVPPLLSRSDCIKWVVPPRRAVGPVAVAVLTDDATEPVLPPDDPPVVAVPAGDSRGDAATEELDTADPR